MVAFLDVDTFLQRGDLELLRELKWPWEVTHFAKAAKCVNCGFLTLSAAPKHFVVLNNEKIVMLLQYPFFGANTARFSLFMIIIQAMNVPVMSNQKVIK